MGTKVLDYKLNKGSSTDTVQLSLKVRLPPPWRVRASQLLPTPPSSRRNGRPSPDLTTRGHLSWGARHLPQGLGKLPIQRRQHTGILFKHAHKFSNLKVLAARTLCKLLSTNV